MGWERGVIRKVYKKPRKGGMNVEAKFSLDKKIIDLTITEETYSVDVGAQLAAWALIC